MDRKISVTGLGYVGLPVAVAFARQQTVIAFDTDATRISQLKAGVDHTGEFSVNQLMNTHLVLTDDLTLLKQANFHIVTVPTPVNLAKQPDLSALELASISIGQQLKKNDIVVYESTGYPGMTEEFCIPLLEQSSGLRCGSDFNVAYSPERINPGDATHHFTNMIKVVAAQDVATLDIVSYVYQRVVEAGVYQAPSIKVAEAAKVIENTQRDLNIALMNELAMIFHRLDIDTQSVLDVAQTKWNFLAFQPGLVGGHCIGVDPYYLTYKAQLTGYQPQVILAGRQINDAMPHFLASQIIKLLCQQGHRICDCIVTVLGMTFKENCPDLRNSKAIELIRCLQEYGVTVQVYDPLINTQQSQVYQITAHRLTQLRKADAIVVAVAHKAFLDWKIADYLRLLDDKPLVIDIKSICPKTEFTRAGIKLWRL